MGTKMEKLKSKSEPRSQASLNPQWKKDSRGFTLIAALLLMILLSGLAVGLLYMVSNEGRAGGNGLEDNLAYYAAESGMEKLTADLSSLYQTSASPSNAQIQNLINFPPTTAMVGQVNYTETIGYTLNPVTGLPQSTSNTISAGPDQGLYAEIIPMTLQVNATRPGGASVNMTRSVEVALIPVFQFGVFCGYDCSYFAGPNFSFGGRVHTNLNLFLASGAELVFNDKIAAFKQLVTDELENGHLTSAGYGGKVYVPSATGGCLLNTFPPPGPNCIALSNAVPGDASWSGGVPPNFGAANPLFTGAAFNGFFVNGATGATNLQLPFVQNSCTSNPPPCTDPIQIIRKPLALELATTTLGQSREYNKAQIRVLIADTQADLHPERGPIGDGQDVQFVPNSFVPVATAFTTTGANAAGNESFGMANTAVDPNWVSPLNPNTGGTTSYGWTSWPLLGMVTPPYPTIASSGVGAWIRIEYCAAVAVSCNTPGAWVGVTTEWLGLGFGRAYNTVLTAPVGSAGQNTINPNALLILQQLSPAATSPTANANVWYPINFYDPREGEMRDNPNGCAVNGIMNAVELDVGNLGLYLAGKGPYGGLSGKLINITSQNGYVLYFSDHRGMLHDPNPTNAGATPAGVISGNAGLEDVVNSGQGITSSTPDGVKEPAVYYGYSPEDTDQNGLLDNWGGVNIGYGFGQNTNTAPPNPYVNINAAPHPTYACNTTGLANMPTGARHVLKLVDGGMNAATATSYLPVRWDNNSGGFTVVSENPVYVQGNYNTGPTDPFWTTGGVTTTTPHSAAAVIADAVSVLSNNWNDLNSLNNPTALGARAAAQTYYRMAVAGGKNIPFPQPAWGAQDFGTDGGLHNFLRLLEAWGGAQLNYDGSLVSMYYAEYGTGTFKCCTVVYGAPPRNFWFDTLFLNPANLPPGTPDFQDVVNLSYHENYTPQ
jgi:Tfp pilus assembly protein PilX